MASTLMISTEENKHDHIVYLYDEVKLTNDEQVPIIGYTSLDGNHRHDVALLPEEPPQIDEQTGQIIKEGTPEQVILMPSKDGHLHKIEGPLQVEYKSRYDESEEERLSRYKDMVRDAEAADKQYIEQAKECEAFYFGGEGQWDEKAIQTLKADGRPFVSLNYTASMVNCVTGYQFQNGTYPIPVPTEDGDQVVADMLRGLNYHYFEKNKFKFIRKDVCKDQCITGRGAYLIRIKTDHNLEKHIIIEKIDWQDVIFTQHDKNTGEDSRAAIFSRWVNVQDLKGVVDKDKYDKILNGSSDHTDDSTFYDKENKRVRQCMVLHREVKERDVLINTLEKKVYVLDGNDGRIHGGLIDKSIKDRILSIKGFTKIKRKTPEIWESLFTTDVIISDEVSHFSDFNLIPAYAIKRKQNVKGIIHDLRDPTRVINKSASLELDYMTRVLNNPMIYDDETFGGDEVLAQKFFQKAKKPGAGLKVADTLKPPVQIQPSPMPPEIPAIRERMNVAQREISGINPELMGGGSEAGSNLLYLQKKNSALLCNEDIFAGLDLADKSVALRLIDVYKKVLTPEDVYRILKNSNSRMSNVGGLEVGGQEFEKYSKEDIMSLWARSDLSKYDIAIGDGQETPTKRAADTAMMVELAKQGVDISGEQLIGRIIDDPQIRKEQQKQARAKEEANQQLEEKKLSIAEKQMTLATEASKEVAAMKDHSNNQIESLKHQLEIFKLQQKATNDDMKNQIEIAKLGDGENKA